MSDPNLSSSSWWAADLPRGDDEQPAHGKVIPSFTVLRRLDCVLDPTKAAVLEVRKKAAAREGKVKLMTVEWPEQDETRKVLLRTKDEPVPDASLRDTQKVPLGQEAVPS